MALALCETAGPAERAVLTAAARAHSGEPLGLDAWSCLASTGDGEARTQLQGLAQRGASAEVRLVSAARLAGLGDWGARQSLREAVRRPGAQQNPGRPPPGRPR